MCRLMDLTEDKLKQVIKDNQENVEWSWAIEILEKHIIYNEYVRPSSLEKALDRVKCG